MSQPLTGESAKHPSSEPGALKPVLKDALVSLDIQLEEELARYRRLRDGHPPPPPRNFSTPRVRKSLDLMSFGGAATSHTVPAAASGSSEATISDFPSPIPPSPTIDNGATTTAPDPLTAPPPTDSSFPAEQQTLNIHNGSASVVGAVVGNRVASPDNASGSESATTSAIAPLPPAETASSTKATTADPEQPEKAVPRDYLASSEHLLQSLSEAEAAKKATAPSTSSPETRSRTLSNRLLSPVGLGLFLLLIVGSSLLGYILVNPSSISHLKIARWLGISDTKEETTTSDSDAANSGELPQGPNLADQEFVNLEVDNLSLLQNNGSSTELPVIPPLPNPQPEETTPSTSASPNALSQLPLPGQIPTASPSPTSQAAAPRQTAPSPSTPRQSTPSPAAAPSPAPSVSVKPSPDETTRNPYYYVIADYINDRALTLAKDLVPGAYVSAEFPELNRPPIQLGAFYTQSEADRMAQELQKKGIPARVYKR